MTYHGGAPRVRHEKNLQTGEAALAEYTTAGIEINEEILLNKIADAVISAGVAYIITKGA